jgi:hypothetical protein
MTYHILVETNTIQKPSSIQFLSILIGLLYFIGLIVWPYDHYKKRWRDRPYVFSTTVILRCFIVRIWLRLDSNRALHHYLFPDLQYNRKVMRSCGLSTTESQSLPSRRTFDRRLKTASGDITERITTMGYLFV